MKIKAKYLGCRISDLSEGFLIKDLFEVSLVTGESFVYSPGFMTEDGKVKVIHLFGRPRLSRSGKKDACRYFKIMNIGKAFAGKGLYSTDPYYAGLERSFLCNWGEDKDPEDIVREYLGSADTLDSAYQTRVKDTGGHQPSDPVVWKLWEMTQTKDE